MPYFNVYISEAEVFDDIETDEIERELDKRRKNTRFHKTPIEDREKAFKLREAALELRRVDKLSLAVWLEDIASEID